MGDDLVQVFKEIAELHRELSEKYNELSQYFYPEDEDISESSIDEGSFRE